MKLPLQARGILYRNASSPRFTRFDRAAGILLAGGTNCNAPNYWCYCPALNTYTCCVNTTTCSNSSGVCTCKTF